METSKVGITKLLPLLEKGKALGLDVTDINQKVEEAMNNQKGGTIKIVLLGSFSDGKTSAIAGLLGKTTKDMKIDPAESSDELNFYHLDGIDKKYEIVDTPGLFGTKEKEVDGKNIKYSDITKKYISNANLLIYVCDAVNPIKDSHIPSLRLVLRTFNKLSSTIFVLNKMDEAGVDMADEEEYEEVSAIKKKTVIKRLKENFLLTDQEITELKIVCISADYKGKGFDYWLNHKSEYAKVSHIQALKAAVNKLIGEKNIDQLKKETEESVLKDSIVILSKQISLAEAAVEEPLRKSDELQKDMKSDLNSLKRELIAAKGEMTKRLKDLQEGLLMDVDNCTDMKQLAQIVETQIGVEDKKVTAYIIQRNVQQILDECAESNKASLHSSSTDFGEKFNLQNKLLGDAISKATSFLSKAKVNSSTVFKVRDALFSSHKFKPWGAIKLANNITKWLGGIGFALSVATKILKGVSELKNEQKLAKSKEDIKNAIKELIIEVYGYFDNDEEYYKNFAPSYIEMEKQVRERQAFLDDLKARIVLIQDFKNLVSKTMGVDIDKIEDAEFEEI